MALGKNAEPDTEWLRYEYTSLTTPDTTYEVNMATGERKLLKRMPVLGGYDLAHYVKERLWAPARDGTKIPVSIVYMKGFKQDDTATHLQYCSGSYGSSMARASPMPRSTMPSRARPTPHHQTPGG